MEETNEAWRLLVDCLEIKDKKITELQKREIELLQKLMKSEENLKGLIHVIAEKTFSKTEPKEVVVNG